MDSHTQILIVDDEPGSREALCLLLETAGYAPVGATDGIDALSRLSRTSVPVIVADVRMPRMDGLALLREISRRELPSAVVMLTGRGDIETAVEAMRQGAHDFLTKPVDPKRLLLSISNGLQAHRLRATLEPALGPEEAALEERGLVGATAAMREVFDLVHRVAPAPANVLVVGESGTGKELVARLIHEQSPRAAHRFVTVHRAPLPPEALEAELFGQERGAGGAAVRKAGAFEQAHQGTLFLEEVADIPLATQAKLVQVLEGTPYRRVGSDQDVRQGARVIAATSQSIARMVDDGRFRPDLYFRLSAVEIHLPALRERGEDVPLLIRRFLADFNKAYGKNVRKVSPAAMDRLLLYPWPGNVRELRNAVERAVILAGGDMVTPADLPANVRDPGRLAGARSEGLPLCSIDEMQRRLVAEALVRFPTRARAAEALGMSVRTLYNRIRRYGLDGRRARADVPGLEAASRRTSRRAGPLSRSA
jgi:DNA-binding NtrC family response regulator